MVAVKDWGLKRESVLHAPGMWLKQPPCRRGPRPGIPRSSPPVVSPDEDAQGRILGYAQPCNAHLSKRTSELGMARVSVLACVTPVLKIEV